MHVFVINLEKDVERRKSIKNQLEQHKMDYTFFPAVYGKLLSKDELSVSYDLGKAKRNQCRSLVFAEIGCALSHVGVYRRIVEEDLPFACILEDDVILPEEFNRIVKDVEQQMNYKTPVVVLMSPSKYKNEGKLKINESYTMLNYRGGFYASSYIVNQLGAKALLKEMFPVGDVADCWKRLSRHKVVDVKVVVPPIVHQDQVSFGSSTTVELNQNYSYNFFKKIRFKLCRVFWLSLDLIQAFYHRNFRPYAGILKDFK